MKIFDVENFPNPARVRIALEEKGATSDVTFVPVDVMGGEHRTEAFMKKNPSAAVPVLELEDGTNISECTAITQYIDETYVDGPSLFGKTAKERAYILMLERKAEAGVVDTAGTYFHHATPGLGPVLETYQNAEWGQKAGEKCLANIAWFNDLLADRQFVAGDAFSVADITLYCGLNFAEFGGLKVDPAFEHLIAWRNRIAARQSVPDYRAAA